MPLCEQRKNEIRDAKISLVEEHKSRDEQIQNKIREKYSMSEEIAILRKETKELKEVIKELLQIEKMSENATEFDAYNEYVEECKKAVKDTEDMQHEE